MISKHPTAAALLVLAGLALSTGAASAADHVNVSAGMTLAGAPLAIHGYDPVAYFTEGKAVPGKDEHTVAYDGGAFRFASEANRKAFEAQPERYAPQYGGFCAYGVALGAKFDGDPRLFAVVDGKLYFNLNPDIQKKWSQDKAGNIRKADGNWKTIRDKAPRDLK
jgi:YHS domain-containing protein